MKMMTDWHSDAETPAVSCLLWGRTRAAWLVIPHQHTYTRNSLLNSWTSSVSVVQSSSVYCCRWIERMNSRQNGGVSSSSFFATQDLAINLKARLYRYNSTQLDVELSCVRRYRHPHRRNSTVTDDRQCNWPSLTAYSQSARSRSVELSCVAINWP